jgi:hypothetical protein
MTEQFPQTHPILTDEELRERIASLESPETPTDTALEILTSEDVMMNLFKTLVPRWTPGEHRVKKCQSVVLKRRLGSRQVISYKLELETNATDNNMILEVIAKRYANSLEGQEVSKTMRRLWDGEFGKGHQSKIPRPLSYLRGPRLLFQEKVRGVSLDHHLARENPSSHLRVGTAGRWLAKLHHHPIEGIRSKAYEQESPETLASRIAERYPSVATRLNEVASLIREKSESFGRVPLAMVHGDFQPENIFATQDGATAIDLDRVHLSDPATDLGNFLAQTIVKGIRREWVSAEVHRNIRAFLDSYLEAIPDHDAEGLVRRIPVRVAASCLEILYYILCVVSDDRPELLSAFLETMTRLAVASKLDEVLDA